MAVNVVQMVFGNKGDGSGTGVCFTRDPSTGESVLYGEFLQNAQGEDVARDPDAEPIERMNEPLPEAHAQLLDDCGSRSTTGTCRTSSSRSRRGRSTCSRRNGEADCAAALRAAVEMVGEGLISQEEAVARTDPAQLDQLLHPMIDPAADVEVVAKGPNASPGAASGAIVFDADTADERGRAGESVILVRWETTPDDFGMVQAAGILTACRGAHSRMPPSSPAGWGRRARPAAKCRRRRARKDRLPAQRAEGRRHDHDRRRHRRRIVSSVPLVPPQINDDFSAILEGGRDPLTEGAYERRHAGGLGEGPGVRRGGSASRRLSTCSPRRSGCS